MTTAHRPTFDPARGKEAQRGPAYHQRLQAEHTKLKVRRPGQGSQSENAQKDLRAQLLEAEAAHLAKKRGAPLPDTDSHAEAKAPKRILNDPDADSDHAEEEDYEAKRRRVLAETRDIDADTSGSEDSSDDDSDDEDEEADLMRELEKIKRERAAQREKEEEERQKVEEEKREKDIALGNPLLNPHKDFNVKRRWDDDVVFKNQARGTEKKSKEFVNDLLRSDFHKRFMSRYVR